MVFFSIICSSLLITFFAFDSSLANYLFLLLVSVFFYRVLASPFSPTFAISLLSYRISRTLDSEERGRLVFVLSLNKEIGEIGQLE